MPTEPQQSLNLKDPAVRRMGAKSGVSPSGPSPILLVFAGVLAGGLLAGVSVWYWSSGKTAKTEDAIIAEVGRSVILPADVRPRVAEMVNPEAFKEDPFWSQAAIGDKILIYPYQGAIVRAIIWRPIEQKIVDIGLVSITPGSTTPQP